MDLNTLYHRTVEAWADRVNAVEPGQWGDPTPCRDWTVRDLVNHVCGEDRGPPPLVAGRTIDDVGDSLDGDLLGDDPIRTALVAASEATLAVAGSLPEGGIVHLSHGEDERSRSTSTSSPPTTWCTAGTWPRPPAATGAWTPTWSTEVAAWFADREELYRTAGAVGPRTASHGDPQGDLLAGFGRDPGWGPNHAALMRFSAAFGRGDVDAIMALMTDDCVFEATGPAPDGVLHEGAEAVRGVWRELFGQTRDAGLHRGGVVRQRRPGRAALAVRLVRRRPARPATCAASTC